MNALRDWWDTLSPRERSLVSLLAVLASAMLLWIAVVLPIIDFRSAARAAHQQALVDHAEAEALLQRLDGEGGAPAAAEVEAIFAEAGLNPAVAPGPDGFDVAINAARADILFTLLSRLEARSGLRIADAAIRTNSDDTLAADLRLEGAAP